MRCPVCERPDVRLRTVDHPLRAGLIVEHRDRRFDGLGKCPASGNTIAEATARIGGRR